MKMMALEYQNVNRKIGTGRIIFISLNFEKIFAHANAINSHTCHRKMNLSSISCLLIIIFLQEYSASGSMWDKVSNIENKTKTMHDIMHMPWHRGCRNKMNYRPQDIIGHSMICILNWLWLGCFFFISGHGLSQSRERYNIYHLPLAEPIPRMIPWRKWDFLSFLNRLYWETLYSM